MTKTKALSIIKQACVEANPSIMDLKFGCRVFVQNYIMSVFILEDRRGQTHVEETQYVLDFVGFGTHAESLVQFNEKHITEILGRPITLSDILLAICKTGEVFSVDSRGWLNNQEVQWDMLKPLHEQELPTLLFIAGILKK